MSSTLGASLLRTVLSDGTLKILGSGLDKGPIIKIKTIQTDNGREFTNYGMKDRLCLFDKVLEELHIEHILTRPYSPWQNGKVERSHRIDGGRFFCRTFSSLEQLVKAHKRYESRYNNIAQKVLDFKNPNEMIREYFNHITEVCVTNV